MLELLIKYILIFFWILIEIIRNYCGNRLVFLFFEKISDIIRFFDELIYLWLQLERFLIVYIFVVIYSAKWIGSLVFCRFN